jgi:hypothetical protein
MNKDFARSKKEMIIKMRTGIEIPLLAIRRSARRLHCSGTRLFQRSPCHHHHRLWDDCCHPNRHALGCRGLCARNRHRPLEFSSHCSDWNSCCYRWDSYFHCLFATGGRRCRCSIGYPASAGYCFPLPTRPGYWHSMTACD